MTRKKITQKNFYQVSGWMILKYRLKSNHLIAYAIIYGFSQNDESYFEGSISYLAEFMNCSISTVKTVLKSLVEAGFLKKVDSYDNNVKLCKYKALLPDFGVGQKLTKGGRSEIDQGGRSISDYNNKYYNKLIKLTKEESVLSFFENLYKERFKVEFSYSGKYKKPYQLEAIKRIIKFKGLETESFLKKCFQIQDNFLSKRLIPHLILENINLFTLNISAEKNNKRSSYPFLTHAQILEKSHGIKNAFADYCRIKKGTGYVYVTKPVCEEYELKALEPGEK